METIAWLGFSQSLFAAIIMISKKSRSIPDKILAGWLSLLAIEFLTCGIDYSVFGYPLLSSSFLLFNPAFYLYVTSLVNKSYSPKWIQLPHLIPFLFFEVFAYVMHEPYAMNTFLEMDSLFWFRTAFSVASIASWIAYNYASAVTIFRHRNSLLNEYSTIESNKKLTWLVFIVVFYNLYCLVLVLTSLLSILLKIEFPLSPIYNYSALLLLVYILGFYGLKQQAIYPKAPFTQVNERYSKSVLTAERKNLIKSKITDFFKSKKPYLNPDFNMETLSNTIGYPKYQITEVLNVDIGKNFFRFVNEFRVEEVKKQLRNAKNQYSIEAIGYECGFSSKSSFFTVFKKITGFTPQEYRNTNLQR
ncbi:MAG TPA: AraC family transcriptional regulator [Tenuifilaceae bacterium]|nr:AraC family transcriptional regulator [Tenuifilaceae bacterium]HPQ33112.1 AraC family transcriptional regulator [Tenuifilaceae bacterium]